jgi:hypothetical protein
MMGDGGMVYNLTWPSVGSPHATLLGGLVKQYSCSNKQLGNQGCYQLAN